MSGTNFNITSDLPVSKRFLEHHIKTFGEACRFVKDLSYGRNENKQDLTTVFTDKRGTCSTKHALLRQLALENHAGNVRLMLGVLKMSKANTPEVGATLDKYGLNYIPEAHNYLRVEEEIIDCTKQSSTENDFINDLLNEIEIIPEQITEFKVNYHQTFLKNWLLDNPEITLGFDQLWAIREKCIADLSSGNR